MKVAFTMLDSVVQRRLGEQAASRRFVNNGRLK